MTTINITGSNRYSLRRTHALRWAIDLPRISDSTGGDYLLEVHSITIENLFPVITRGYNDKLYYTYNNIQSYIQFSEGNYTIYDLLDSLQTELQVLNPAFTATYDSTQNKTILFIPAGQVFGIRRQGRTDNFNPYDYTNSSGDDRFLELLGWNFLESSKTFLAGPAGYTWVPNNCVRCVGPQWLDMCVTLPVRGSFSQQKGRFNVISRVYLDDTNFGQVHSSQNAVPEKYSVTLLGNNEFEIFFIDDHGVPVIPSSTFNENIVVGYRMSFIPIQQ